MVVCESTFELIGFGIAAPKSRAAAAMLQVGATFAVTENVVVVVAAHVGSPNPSSTNKARSRLHLFMWFSIQSSIDPGVAHRGRAAVREHIPSGERYQLLTYNL